jgi:hypothetical protein
VWWSIGAVISIVRKSQKNTGNDKRPSYIIAALKIRIENKYNPKQRHEIRGVFVMYHY